jgi:predicted nucleic acid-binding Zn ribbon protein
MKHGPDTGFHSGGPNARAPQKRRTTRAGRTVELKESLADLTRLIGTAPPDTLARVFAKWTETVGEGVAAHARPERLDGDALVVTVDSPAWSSHLRNLTPELLAKLSDGAGEGAPSRLVIRVRAVSRGPDPER